MPLLASRRRPLQRRHCCSAAALHLPTRVELGFTRRRSGTAERANGRRLLITWNKDAARSPFKMAAQLFTPGKTKKIKLPSPDEDDSLSAREEESAWSFDSPSIRGIESSEEGTEES